MSSSSSKSDGTALSMRSRKLMNDGEGSPDVNVGLAFSAFSKSIASVNAERLGYSLEIISTRNQLVSAEHKDERRQYIPMRFTYDGSTSIGRVVNGVVSSVGAAAGAHVNLEVPTTLFPAGGTGATGTGTAWGAGVSGVS